VPLGAGPDLTQVENQVNGQLLMPLRVSELYNLLVGILLGSKKRISVPCVAAPSEAGSRYRFLVVDDNEINRFLAVEQLEGLGYRVDVAADGQQAVEKVKSCDYAAVLMDCQMPVMDGYTATRVIRDWEGTRRHTPIIALTAHALVGERDKVVAAGMDDYLAKPVRTQTLERVLQQVIESTRLLRAASPDAAEVPPSLLDPNVDRSPRLMELFIERVPETLRELDAAVHARHADDIRSKAHKLKGSCLALGAEAMAADAEALEHRAKAGEISDCDVRADRLRAQYTEVAAALRAQLAATAGKASSDPPHRVSA
jgi:CheY-like chemotaxis protein/HPt (histidine-containing phosphotransfer) domain-containing protein